MHARLFSCCGRNAKRSPRDENDIELVERLLTNTNQDSRKKCGYSYNQFTIHAEATWGTIKAPYASLVAIAGIATFAFDLEAEYFGASILSILATLPVALILSMSEVYMHYQESKNYDEVVNQDHSQLSRMTLMQHLLIGAHYLSDVSQDLGSFIGSLQANDNKISRNLKWGFIAAVLLLSMAGNLRGLTNTATAIKLRNAREEREASNSLRASIS